MTLNLSISTIAVLGWIGLAAAMSVLWLVQRRTGNAGIVDAGWTFGVGGLAVFFAAAGSGWLPRRTAIALLFALWSARLGSHLLRDRIIGKPEEGRYVTLRQQWYPHAARRFFWFFQAQALAALFFALPPLLASSNDRQGFHPLELSALGLWLIGFLGEATADRQLEQFKRDPANRGRTCRTGLWHYSRHPNYFFEWLMWIAYALFASASPLGAAAFACPAVMLYLLFQVTGIPATEAQAVRSRGDEYREYQRTTSAFVPWRPAA